MNQWHQGEAAVDGELTDPGGVDLVRVSLVVFSAVHIGVRGAIDHACEARGDCVSDRIGAGEIEARQGEGFEGEVLGP